MLKGYKINAVVVIENSIMRYHEGNKRGLIPHPATIMRLCLRASVKGTWEEEEECPKVSPVTLTGVSKGPRNQKKKGIIIEVDSREENENARQKRTPFWLQIKKKKIQKHIQKRTPLCLQRTENKMMETLSISQPHWPALPLSGTEISENLVKALGELRGIIK